MGFSIPDCFMIAFAVGFIFGLVYEALRIIRLILRFKAAIFVCDITFFVLAAQVVFKLSEILGSYVRIYTVLGFGAGIFTYIVTVGRLLNLMESAASIAWRKTIGKLIRNIGKNARNAFSTFAQKTQASFGRIAKYFLNVQKKHTLHLKSKGKTLYNKERLEKIGESEKAHVIKATVRKSS